MDNFWWGLAGLATVMLTVGGLLAWKFWNPPEEEEQP